MKRDTFISKGDLNYDLHARVSLSGKETYIQEERPTFRNRDPYIRNGTHIHEQETCTCDLHACLSCYGKEGDRYEK